MGFLDFIGKYIWYILVFLLFIILVADVLYIKYFKSIIILKKCKDIYLREIPNTSNDDLKEIKDFYKLIDKLEEDIKKKYEKTEMIYSKKARINRMLNSATIIEGLTIVSVCFSVILSLYTATMSIYSSNMTNIVNTDYKIIDAYENRLKDDKLSEDDKNDIKKHEKDSYDNISFCLNNSNKMINSVYLFLVLPILLFAFYLYENISKEILNYKKAFYMVMSDFLENQILNAADKNTKDEIKYNVEDIKVKVSSLGSVVYETKKLMELYTRKK